jgi:hypothetical protein
MTHLNGIVRLSVLASNLLIASILTAFSPSSVESSEKIIDLPARVPAVVGSAPQWLVEEDRPQIVQVTVVEEVEVVKKNVPRDKTKRCPDFEPVFRKYGLKPVETFSYIAWRESRCRVKAINAKWDSKGRIVWTLNRNGSYDSGILQVNSSWKTVTKQICGGGIDLLLTLDCNLKVSKYLLDNGGLRHWSM